MFLSSKTSPITVNDAVIRYLKSKAKSYKLSELELQFGSHNVVHGQVINIGCEKFVVELNTENKFECVPYWPITEISLNYCHLDDDVAWFAQYGRNSQSAYYPTLRKQRNKVIQKLQAKVYDVASFPSTITVIDGVHIYPTLHKLYMHKLSKLDVIERV